MTTKNNIPAGYKDSAVGIIPQEWEVKALGEAYKLQGGYAFKSELFADIGIPIVRISNLPMDSNIVDITDCVYYPNTESIKEQFIIKQGMLLIAMSGATTGKTAVYNSQNSSYLNQRVGNIKVIDSTILNDKYRNFYIQAKEQDILKNAYGGAQPNISSTKICAMPFPLPPTLAEQQRIVNRIESMFAKLDEAKEKAQNVVDGFETRKAAILHKAFTGELTAKWRKENGIEKNKELDFIYNFVNEFLYKSISCIVDGITSSFRCGVSSKLDAPLKISNPSSNTSFSRLVQSLRNIIGKLLK